MITLYDRFTLWTSASIATFLMVRTPALANNLFGPVPEIGGTNDIRGTVVGILKTILNFMALAAVVFIVIAGIRLIFSQGEDAEKDKAKKTILFVVAGLVLILLAQAIVTIVATQFAESASP